MIKMPGTVRDIGRFRLAMEACTRLRQMAIDVRGDQTFAATDQNKIIFVVDNNVINLFADPLDNHSYVK